MSLTDYTYIATLGHGCGPCFQLQRAARGLGLHQEQLSAPFDWQILDLKQLRAVLSRNFKDYFCPRQLAGVELHDGHWRVTDRSGAMAWHQLPADEGAREPSATTWWAFGIWLGARIHLWQRHTNDSKGNLLLIRHENPFQPDGADDLLSALDLLRQRIAGQFRLAWVTYADEQLHVDAPNVEVFQVRRAWPENFAQQDVDYDRDYGFGPAWRGRNDDWDRIWRSL